LPEVSPDPIAAITKSNQFNAGQKTAFLIEFAQHFTELGTPPRASLANSYRAI